MAELVAPPPHNCPGTESTEAGKGSACAGCPNQQVCSTTPKGPDPDVGAIIERLKGVKQKILILSGKGGVGKSTFSSQLAFALSENPEHQVGLLDIDICGPSIPKMMGVEHEQVHQSNQGWSPVYVTDNLCVMSVGFMLNDANDAVIWRGPKKNGLIKQFLRDVDWSDLDYLLVDTPPGTSDEHLSIVQYLKESGVDGAVVLTQPQEVSLMDVRKEINFCKKVNIPVLGVVENMSTFVCPKCHKSSQIFVATTGGGETMAKEMGVPFLGRIPLDPRLARCSDEGKNFVQEFKGTQTEQAYTQVINNLLQQLKQRKQQQQQPDAMQQ